MIQEIGVPSLVLMERAAADTVTETLKRVKKPMEELRVLAVCGSGNNGGDGYAAARIFSIKGAEAHTLLIGNPEHLTEETKTQREICQRLHIPEVEADDIDFRDYDIIIDAIFGIGLSREVSGTYAEIINRINHSTLSHGEDDPYIVSVDIPSGIHADTGEVMGCAIEADLTVTMEFLKPGLLLFPGSEYAGEIVDAEIGIEEIVTAKRIYLPEKEDLKTIFSHRTPDGNKGTFGKLLVIAGSRNMSGAAYFAAKAALQCGIGMVKILTTEDNRIILQQQLPEAMLSTYETAEDAIECLKSDLDWCDGILAGPGMGNNQRTREIVEYLLKTETKPLVLDADALNAIADDTQLLDFYKGLLTITPHLGEMSRLSKIPVSALKQNPLDYAFHFAKEHDLRLIMKDARTVTAEHFSVAYINIYGNSGMATAGSGDVLAGITAALAVLEAKRVFRIHPKPSDAVMIHALSGDFAKEAVGKTSLTANDLIDAIKSVFQWIESNTG